MSSLFNDRDASEDLFADTRMSFGDHIEELRWHLFRAIIGTSLVLVGVFVLDGIGYFLNPYLLPYHIEIGAGKPLMDFIARPVERELNYFYERRIQLAKAKADSGLLPEMTDPKEVTVEIDSASLASFRKALHLPPEEDGSTESTRVRFKMSPGDFTQIIKPNLDVIRPPLLSMMSITEGFMIYIKVSLVLGVVLSSPWIFYQLWSFVAAGLYPAEKKYVHVYGPFSLVLFLAGVVLCELIVIPAAVHYLLSFGEWMSLDPVLRLSDWLSFALLTPLVFGIAFQTPLVMLFLHKLGIMDVSVFRKHRRIAIMVLALLACLLAASPDAFSMLALAIPLWCLYELGIILCRFSPRTLFDEVPDEEEVVEV
jgi:sec-independent protein translocase protein TatC